MNYKRLIRDLGLLGVFCVGFYLVTRAINLLGEEHQEPVQVEFSETRRSADRQFTRKDYRSAIRYFSKLTEEDEFNSYAWYKLGESYENLYEQSMLPSLADPAFYSADNQKKQNELADKAIAAFMHVIDYPRYRSSAMMSVAKFHILRGNNGAALDILEMIVGFDTGTLNPSFITRAPFSKLKDEPGYAAIKNQLEQNASGYNRHRRADRRLGVSGSPISPQQESGGSKK